MVVCSAPCRPGRCVHFTNILSASAPAKTSCTGFVRAQACDQSIATRIGTDLPRLTWPLVQHTGGLSTESARRAQQQPAGSSSRLKQEATRKSDRLAKCKLRNTSATACYCMVVALLTGPWLRHALTALTGGCCCWRSMLSALLSRPATAYLNNPEGALLLLLLQRAGGKQWPGGCQVHAQHSLLGVQRVQQ